MTYTSATRTRVHFTTLLLGAVALSALASAAAAQTAPANVVGEVVITARHRNESLQKVPIAVSVVSGDQAAAKNLNDIQDISAQVPSVDFRTSASNKDRTVFVRGVGTISTSPGVEPSVSTVVDGVVMARAGQATVDLLDVDHIEVLQGPQGTLFGKNATAGVINIVTKNPTATPQGYVDGSIFGGSEYRLGVGISGPIIADKLEGLFSAFSGQYGGNVRNLDGGAMDNGYQHTGFRGKLLAHPTESLTLTLAGDYTHSVDSTPTGVWVSSGKATFPNSTAVPNATLATALTAQGITPGTNNTTVNDNDNSSVHDINSGVSLQADWDLGGGYRLTSITAFRDWRNKQFQDYDQLAVASTGLPQVADVGDLRFHQTSEELRIASPKGQFIDYVAGVYYLDSVDNETYQRSEFQVAGSAAPGNNVGLAHYGSTDQNYSVFGEADVNFTSSLRAIVGIRGIDDDLSFYDTRVSTSPVAITGIGVNFAANGSTNKSGYAGRLGLQYDLSPDITTYATYSRGYMGPAYNVFFNMAAANTPALNPETSNSYELGLKSQLFDHRVQADLSAFITDFQNYQANFTQSIGNPPSLITNLINAGSVTSRGVEANIIARPFQNLSLNFDGVYDDAYVVNFPCPTGSPASCFINGQPLPFAPRWKAHVEGEYKIPVADAYYVDLETEYNWQSATQYQLSESPQTIQPAYGIWNASIGLLNDGNGLSARILAKNLADTHYSSYLAPGDLGGLVRWVPRDNSRYFGVNIRKTFG